MKHTPGEWVAIQGPFEEYDVVITENNSIVKHVAREIESEDDANLMAASKDLLKVCRNVLSSLRDTEAFFSESPNTQAMVLNYLCNQVVAAIDKAEGK